MQEVNVNQEERFFVDSVKELDSVNKKIAKLLLKKEELTNGIINVMDHDHEGQKTYEYSIWKIEVKTPVVYSLNKKLYESGEFNIPDAYNPIKHGISYTIDKRLCEKFINEAPENARNALIALIEKKPGKPSICIKERI